MKRHLQFLVMPFILHTENGAENGCGGGARLTAWVAGLKRGVKEKGATRFALWRSSHIPGGVRGKGSSKKVKNGVRPASNSA